MTELVFGILMYLVPLLAGVTYLACRREWTILWLCLAVAGPVMAWLFAAAYHVIKGAQTVWGT